MHEGEETQQSVVIAIEEAFFVWFMLGIPEMTDEFPALHMIADQRSRSRSGNKTDRMAECLRSRTCRQNIFYHRSIYIILVQERINALTIQEVL